MVLPEILSEDLMDEVIGIVLIHLDFFQDDATLASDVLGIENRIQHQVAEHVERNRKMFVQHFYTEADTLLGRKRVNVPANGIDLTRDIFSGPMLRALEHHVLDKVRYAVPLQVFVARTRLDPYSYRDGANMLHLLGDDAQSVG